MYFRHCLLYTSGVLNPALVRPRAEGGYELVAGHRRKRACELAGRDTMPVIVREYSDDESVVIMVDSNIQRDNILPSEKAFAYKMKLEALKHQGVKSETGSDAETADLVGKEAGDSGCLLYTSRLALSKRSIKQLWMLECGKCLVLWAVTAPGKAPCFG